MVKEAPATSPAAPHRQVFRPSLMGRVWNAEKRHEAPPPPAPIAQPTDATATANTSTTNTTTAPSAPAFPAVRPTPPSTQVPLTRAALNTLSVGNGLGDHTLASPPALPPSQSTWDRMRGFTKRIWPRSPERPPRDYEDDPLERPTTSARPRARRPDSIASEPVYSPMYELADSPDELADSPDGKAPRNQSLDHRYAVGGVLDLSLSLSLTCRSPPPPRLYRTRFVCFRHSRHLWRADVALPIAPFRR